MNVEMKEQERLDDLHRCGYQIIQNPKMFCFGMDAVLLANFAKVNSQDVVLDMGTGNGIIPLLMDARYHPKHITGLEIQEANVDMARRSAAYNNISDKIDIVLGDIKEADSMLPLSSFDVVTCNPPYMDSGKGLRNDHSAKTIARHEVLCDLEDVISSASKLTKVGGRFYMVHRPHRLVDIISLCRAYKMEPKQIRFVHPYETEEANMVLIETVRYGMPWMKMLPPLIVYREKNVYTEELKKLYYD